VSAATEKASEAVENALIINEQTRIDSIGSLKISFWIRDGRLILRRPLGGKG